MQFVYLIVGYLGVLFGICTFLAAFGAGSFSCIFVGAVLAAFGFILLSPQEA